MSEVGGVFLLIITVDMILGPMITLLIFNNQKSPAELKLDLGFIVLLQTAALTYGVWTIFMVRPVHLVFEFDRFRVVYAIDIRENIATETFESVNVTPYGGPSLLGLRKFKDVEEEVDATIAALQGFSLSSRPYLWQSYNASRIDVMRAAQPIKLMRQRFPNKKIELNAFLQTSAVPEDLIRFLPLVGRKSFWTILIDGRNGDVIGFLPIDSF